MITLFRRIRQKLIESGSVTKYLLYATGEILLVVVGILIALQVNNWNEERKLLSEEQRVLESLRTEISQSIVQLEDRYERESETTETIKIILKGGSSFDSLLTRSNVDSLMMGPIWFTVTEVPVLQTYSDLKSSGKISIIQNYRIREGLSELQFGLNNLDRQQRDLLTVQQLRIDGIAIDRIDFISLLHATDFKELPAGAVNDYRTLYSDRSIRNTLGAKLALMSTALDIRKEIIAACTFLLEVIEQELKK
ncbi:DUF6090 family protein [Balneola sp. MJW-20]|uniref:DUF6090 family protein n=1 Tax=Gracilimonas aurantiaca TaxID=3234185 RepID=UPI003466A8D0